MLDVLDIVFPIIFTIEIVIKMIVRASISCQSFAQAPHSPSTRPPMHPHTHTMYPGDRSVPKRFVFPQLVEHPRRDNCGAVLGANRDGSSSGILPDIGLVVVECLLDVL